MLHGIDVSRYQKTIDWSALAPAVDFAFIRATYGSAYVDERLSYNRREAARYDLVRGYYHFAVPSKGAVEQALHTCAAVGDLGPGELDLVLDLEWTQHAKDGKEKDPSHVWTAEDTEYLKTWTRRFVETVKKRYPGRSVLLYTRHNFWHAYLGGSTEHLDCPLWIAAYTRGDEEPPKDPKQWEAWALQKPLMQWAPWGSWSFWQFSAKASLAGVKTSVDANLFAGTRSDLHRLARRTGEPTTPRPLPTADALCRVLLSQSGDPYAFGHEVILTAPNPPAFDCSELVEWGCAQLGVAPMMPDGSWLQASHVKKAGLLVPVETAISTRGALLFRFSSDPFASPNQRPEQAHVAVSLGDGRTIEARSTQHGVGVFPALGRGWTHAGKVPGLDYSAVPQGGALARGAKGVEVVAWQRNLLQWRPGALPAHGADGDFGTETDKATRVFQQEMGLPITGVVGPETREAMQRALAQGTSGGSPSTPTNPPNTTSEPPVHIETSGGGTTFALSAYGRQITVTVTPAGALTVEMRPPATPPASSKDDDKPKDTQSGGKTGLEGLPPRPANALTGTQLHEKARSLSLAAREELIFAEVMRGNVPSFLRRFHPVPVSAPGLDREGVLYVCPDYLAVGSDQDFLRIPLTGPTAQRIADACGCVLPTKRMVDLFYRASRKQVAIPMNPEGGTHIDRFVEHHRAIEKQRMGELGELFAGHKKDIVVTNRLNHFPRRLALYGFFKNNGEPWQPLDTTLNGLLPHLDVYCDYCHGVRLVGGVMDVGAARMRVAEVLFDPVLCKLVSDEGVIGAAKYEVRALG